MGPRLDAGDIPLGLHRFPLVSSEICLPESGEDRKIGCELTLARVVLYGSLEHGRSIDAASTKKAEIKRERVEENHRLVSFRNRLYMCPLHQTP